MQTPEIQVEGCALDCQVETGKGTVCPIHHPGMHGVPRPISSGATGL